MGPIGIDRDVLVTGGLCHDFSPRNIERWQADPGAVEFPSVRHPGYGVNMAITVGLPEAVVHIVRPLDECRKTVCATGLENELIQYADYALWKILSSCSPCRSWQPVSAI
jgi:hypothetical protein